MIFIEAIILVIAFILSIMWSKNPEGIYEPYIVICTLMFIGFEIFRRITKPIAETRALDTDKGENHSKVTVKEIIKSINSSPPFQKKEISEKYNGIKVKWTGYLKEAHEDYSDKESVRVNLNINKSSIIGYNFWFTEKTHKIPEIRTLKKGTPISVEGEIINASGDGMCVTLTPMSIEILK